MNKEELLFRFCLRIADNNFILSHRLSEMCSKGPILEEDIAMTNISLDLLGQASGFYKYCVELENKGRTEDDLAYHRNERQFYNFQLSEQPNVNFAFVLIRQFFSDAYHYHLYEMLSNSNDTTIAALAEKSLKEACYHLKHSGQLVNQLGNGTIESKCKIQDAIDELWMYTEELFVSDEIDTALLELGVISPIEEIGEKWNKTVLDLFKKANVFSPTQLSFQVTGSKKGLHTEHLGHILTEMQYLQRAYPDASW
jgi:ring-1,2-phenylacetyl-CoA epoxidase subunit PaaC